MPDARAVSPVARQRRNLLRSPAFLVRPQLLTRCSSLPTALPKKSVLQLICYRFNALNISIILSILSFWAKLLPPGRGFLAIVKLTAERKNTFHSVGISSGSTALTSYLGR
jgi:hypothetical protein